MLLASLLSHGVHTPYSLINGSQTYYLLSPATSRSPNQYLKWVEWEDGGRASLLRPYVLRSTQDEVSKEARWFIVPEPECDDGLESTPCYYHIFGGKDSVQPAMMRRSTNEHTARASSSTATPRGPRPVASIRSGRGRLGPRVGRHA